MGKFFASMAWLSLNLTVFLALVLAAWLGGVLLTGGALLTVVGASLTGFFLVCVGLIQLSYRYNWAGAPLVLPPPVASEAPQALILIQGEGIPIERYRPLAQTIQALYPGLWVGIPQFIGDAPIPREMDLAVSAVRRQMAQAGFAPPQAFFIAHSEGGVALQKYLSSYSHLAHAQILLGSFLTRSRVATLNPQGQSVTNYPVSTLTIGGTLDGLARITRIAVAFWHQQINQASPQMALRFPVVALDGVSHIQFASGPATGFVADFDLIPRVSEAEAHQQVGDLVKAFMDQTLGGGPEEVAFWAEQERKTHLLLQPLLKALTLEGYNGFKPACYARAEDNPRHDPSCTPGSPWVEEYANQIMAGSHEAPVPFDLEVLDNFHRSATYDPFHLPHVHIPEIRNSCSGSAPCTLEVTSVTEALYSLLDSFDTGFFPVAAFSLRSKLNSRQNFWSHAGVVNPDFQQTDGPSRGSQINQQAYDWALEHAAPAARDYFEAQGVPLAMGPDILPPVAAGPLWIWNYPHYQYLSHQYKHLDLPEQPVYRVCATTMKTPIDYFIPAAAGFHYCQLLSPAAAMEWIYVDGLRPRASLRGTPFAYGPWGGLLLVVRFGLRGLLRQTRLKGLWPRRPSSTR